MAACLVKAMGHKVLLVRFGAYRTVAGALSAIRRGGYASVEAMLDERFARIPAASALPGDILALPSELPFPALAIYVGNGAALHSWQGLFTVSRVLTSEAAWRVPPVGGAHG
ncbi:hypothetical protein ABI_21930 [Asticcacaulis biprosthecium C19]|uniref:DUF6950 domain-containing protein n=2 Tax=Asticcacaulis biprosthecium TaxID=76891 RepID=F4QGZ8_9CAUL|nr:hypothetical protein [Asticcacaulis biprosthecium]EGF93751.1 hypothetical protein ABI_21930 [Asticcacaulis biprosthecium C19]